MRYFIHTPSQLAAALKATRKQQSSSQQTVGKTAGLYPKTISLLESTPERSSVESLFKLLSALGLEMTLASVDDSDPNSSDW